MSGAVARELEATLEAALLDPGAATALKAGVLTSGLRYAGLGWSGATDGPFLSAGTSEPEALVGRAEKAGPGLPAADDALRLGGAAALREAEAHLAKAALEADESERRLEEAVRDRDSWRRKVADLAEQCASAREEAKKAEKRFADAEEALTLAKQRVRTVQARLVEENSGLSG